MIEDRELQRDVVDALDWEPRVDAGHIGVTVRDGVVTLIGHVGTYGEKLVAVQAAAGVEGVRGVANEIEVRAPGENARDDEEVARSATEALRWNTLVPEDRIRVLVEDGVVTLEGEVEWRYQSNAAAEAIQYLEGVRDIFNRIEVRPGLEAEDVKERIERALGRAAGILHPEHIRVAVQNGNVVLEGSADCWRERQRAEEVAWSAPGVVDVDNRLEV